MSDTNRVVSVSASSSNAAFAEALRSRLSAHGFRVLMDIPAGIDQRTSWGQDEVERVDDAFADDVGYCILLLDKSYQKERWYNYRRSALLDAVARRKGFILPVQIGEDNIEIRGLTTLGKLKITSNDVDIVTELFIEKFEEFPATTNVDESLRRDFMSIIKLYNDKLRLTKIDSYFDSSSAIGYQIVSAKDPVTGQSTIYVLIEAMANIEKTTQRIQNRHGREFRESVVILLLDNRGNPLRDSVGVLLNARRSMGAANGFFLDEFIWLQCTPSYFSETTSKFPISGFVEPAIDGLAEGALSGYLLGWFRAATASVMLVRGTGGIGKTTLAQWFGNQVSDIGGRVIFVTDDAIVDYILKSPHVYRDQFSIYDVYLAYQAQMYDGGIEERITKEQFDVNYTIGKIFVIIDGLDQVISRLGSAFPIENFMESLHGGGASRSKALITCRSEFLPESYFSHRIAPIEVRPFDRKRAEAFFGQRFPGMPRVVARGIEIAAGLTKSPHEEHYVPFLLDIVVSLLQDRMEKTLPPTSGPMVSINSVPRESLLSDGNENDWIVYRVCAREHEKYPNGMEPDDQIRCMLALAVAQRGSLPIEHLEEFCESVVERRRLAVGQAATMLAHPLLSSGQETLTFRYDVIKEHFRSIYVSHLFTGRVVLNDQAIALLSERNRFASEQLRQSTARIRLSADDLAYRAVELVGEISQRTNVDSLEKSRAKTTLLLMSLQAEDLIDRVDRTKATALLRELFGSGAHELDQLCLVDVRERILFDFRGITINNSTFINYSSFWECEFDETTYFRSCNFSTLYKDARLNTPLERANFDGSCILDQSVFEALNSQQVKIRSSRLQRERDIVDIFRLFIRSGYVIPQKEVMLRAKYRGQWPIQDALRKLIDMQVLVPYVSEKSVKMGPELQIASRYHADARRFVQEAHATDQIRAIIREVLE